MVTHERISLVMLSGKPKDARVLLMKDHSNLSKVFCRSILRIMLAYFPFIFLKWLVYSCTMMAFSLDLLLNRKLAWLGPMIDSIIGLILLTMILVINLYIVLERPIGLKFFSICSICTLRNQAEIGCVNYRVHFMIVKYLLAKMDDLIL